MSDATDRNGAEERLIAAARAGTRARLRDETVPASLIRELLTAVPDPLQAAGLAIDGARIAGVLDLEGLATDRPLLFFACRFGEPGRDEAPLVLRDARLRRVGLYDCEIHGGIKAERVQIESTLFMGRSRVVGTMRLRGARIGGSLNLEEASFRDAGGQAIVLDSAEIRGNWLMRDAQVSGTLRFIGAQIDGSLLMESARFEAPDLAILADGAAVNGAWVLNRATVHGRVRMRSAQMRGILASDAELVHGIGPALDANGARLDGDCTLERSRIEGGVSILHAKIDGRFEANDARISGRFPALDAVGTSLGQGLSLERATIRGGIAIDGARIGRDLQMDDLQAERPDGDAISASVVRVEGNWRVRGAQIAGTLAIPGAHVEGELDLSRCTIAAPGGVAIRADGVHLDGGFAMEHARIDGLVRLPASTVGNQLRFSGSELRVARGPALFANSVTVARGVVLADGFTSVGGVCFDQATIAGPFDVQGSRLVSARLARGTGLEVEEAGEHLVGTYDAAVLSLVDARLDRLQLPRLAEHRPRGLVNLARAATGSFEDHAAAWAPTGPGVDDTLDHFMLDGFSYEYLENPGGEATTGSTVRVWEKRVRWLEGQLDRDLDELFKPAPWVQLARRLRAQGYHEDARQISIARQRRHRRSRSVRATVRLQSQLLDWFALYGHSPWRTVAWIVTFVALFAAVWQAASSRCGREDCGDETVFVRIRAGDFADDPLRVDATYPAFNPLAYSFDLFVPIFDFGHREFWRPNTRYHPLVRWDPPVLPAVQVTVGGLLYVLTVVEMVLGLILTSLAVTGFTGLIARDD